MSKADARVEHRTMNRSELLTLWNDMANEGNWVPSWPDSLRGLSVAEALWSPDPRCHSIWQEVAHTTFWRRYTLAALKGERTASGEEAERQEFALPPEPNEEAWAATVEALESTHAEIAELIPDERKDVSRVTYHLIHDAYHLGRITQLRAMQGVPPAI
jgi:hypothetical protein